MSKILLSINPEYVNNIFKGIKKYEYRTKVAKNDVDTIVIYCTYPTKKIVGEVKVNKVICDTPLNLWKKTKSFSGVKKSFYEKYFENRDMAYAYELGDIVKYDMPKDLNTYGIKSAPQSYIYLKY